MQLNAEQARGVELGTDPTKRVVAITGPAGSGKTTVMREIYDGLKRQGIKPVLAAPTGKAAKRITEATGIPAMTIHKLLEFTEPDEETGYSYPQRDASRPIGFDCVMADEYSMVSNDLHQHLRNAFPPKGIIRVFGDMNQLQPIEEVKVVGYSAPVSPFQSMMDRFPETTVKLTQVMRQAEGSGISAAAMAVLKQRMPVSAKDFKFHMVQPETVERSFFTVLNQLVEQGVDLYGLGGQIIVPTHRDGLGTGNINRFIQRKRFDNTVTPYVSTNRSWPDTLRYKDQSRRISLSLYLGDKVIVTKNNYDIDVLNGETGVIVDVEPIHRRVTVDFGDRKVEFSPNTATFDDKGNVKCKNTLKIIEPAYAITVHKAQGSEFDYVFYCLGIRNQSLTNWRAVYTAITRAKHYCYMLTTKQCVDYSIWYTRKLEQQA